MVVPAPWTEVVVHLSPDTVAARRGAGALPPAYPARGSRLAAPPLPVPTRATPGHPYRDAPWMPPR